MRNSTLSFSRVSSFLCRPLKVHAWIRFSSWLSLVTPQHLNILINSSAGIIHKCLLSAELAVILSHEINTECRKWMLQLKVHSVEICIACGVSEYIKSRRWSCSLLRGSCLGLWTNSISATPFYEWRPCHSFLWAVTPWLLSVGALKKLMESRVQ